MRKHLAIRDNQDGTCTITTSAGQEILISDADREKAMCYSWCLSKTGYPVANIRKKVTKMHRYLLGLDNCDKRIVDHINGNCLDNRRENLRICTQRQNGKNLGIKKTNSSGCAGVRVTPHGTFNVRITVDREEKHIGNYKTFFDAVQARKSAEKFYYGEFAPNGRNVRAEIR
jgi:hypothetical protein